MLSSTRGVSLHEMNVSDKVSTGIQGDSVTNFVLSDSRVAGYFSGGAGIALTNLAGTSSITRTVFESNAVSGATIQNSSTLANVTVADSTFSSSSTPAAGSAGLVLAAQGTGAITAAVTGNTFTGTWPAGGIAIASHDGSGRVNATISNNTVTLGAAAGDGISVAAGVAGDPSTASVCAAISGNTSTSAAGSGIRVRQLGANTVFLLAGYSGSPGDDAAGQAYLSGGNSGRPSPRTTTEAASAR